MGCTNEASSDCGGPEGTGYARSADLPMYQPISQFILIHLTCCESYYIHWTSRKHSASTKTSLVDSEGIVYPFLKSIKCVLQLICTESALIKIGPTCSSVIDNILLCVAGRQPRQIY